MLGNNLAVALAATSALTMPVLYPTSMVYPAGQSATETTTPARRRKRNLFPALGRRRRSKGPQAHPQRKRNMVTLGRRVRRKHRRAA